MMESEFPYGFKNMKIAIRADASSQIGSGHVMRCASLAERAHQQGYSILFICRFLPPSLFATLIKRGYEIHQLPPAPSYPQNLEADNVPHALWLGTDWQTDATQTCSALKAWGGCDWLVVDHYALDSRWENIVKTQVPRLFVLDDLANRKHNCDILLDQNFPDEQRYDAYVPQTCLRLCGPQYALLRSEFTALRATISRPPLSLRNILISYGGSDPSGEAIKCLQGLYALKRRDLKILIVAGILNARHEELRNLAVSCGATYEDQVNDMAQRMAWADLAFGALGSTTWEQFCLGLNTIMTAIVPEQVPLANILTAQNLVTFVGEHADISPEDYANAFLMLEHTPDLWRERCRRIMAQVDGQGVNRVIEQMEKTEPTSISFSRE